VGHVEKTEEAQRIIQSQSGSGGG